MNLINVRTFLAVMETGSLSRASERLHVTQSTVTARLSALESEIGQTLFHRRKSGAELTSAGFKFQRYAELMSDLWSQALLETSLPSGVGAICNIGCQPDLWHGFGERFLAELEENAADVAYSVWPGEQADLARWLRTGLVDLVFCFVPPNAGDTVVRKIFDDELVLVSTRPRPLMRWDPAYVYVDMGETFRRDHAAAYPDGDTPTRTFGSGSWALEYLLANGGSAYLPARLADPHLAAGTLHAVAHAPVFKRPAYVAARRGLVESWSWYEAVLDSAFAGGVETEG